MTVAIVTPSAAFSASAGARVRYGRIMDAAPPGTFRLVPLDDLTTAFDGYLFAKTYHPVVPALAAHLAASGKRVVLDVFDDYFSIRDDVRLNRFTRWFDQMARAVHGVTVSTPALAARIAPFTRTAPVVVPDPAPAARLDALAETLAARRRPDPQALHFGWFGIASNPLFPAGLADLAAVVGALAEVPGSPRLTILTNLEGASDTVLAALARAPVPITLRPWSETAEAALTAEVDAVLLPVNRQPFSAVKSPNRALTALAGGTQVIALGTNIYADLDPLIYRSVSAFIADAAAGTMRLRPERIAALRTIVDNTADAAASARTLINTFAGIRPDPRPPVAVLLGRTDPLPAIITDGPLIVRAAFSSAPVAADITLGRRIAIGPRARAALPLTHRWRMRGGTLSADRVSSAPLPTGGAPANPMRAHLRLAAGLPVAEAAVRALLPRHTLFIADQGVLL